jgi:hypothetical protein
VFEAFLERNHFRTERLLRVKANMLNNSSVAA